MNKDFEEPLALAKRDLEKKEAVRRSKPASRPTVNKQKLKRKKWLFAGLIGPVAVLVIVIGVVVMNGNTSLTGRWRIDDATVYEFDENGNGVMCTSLNEYAFTYTAEGSTLTIDFENGAAEDTAYQYSVQGETLTLERGTEVYKLKKD